MQIISTNSWLSENLGKRIDGTQTNAILKHPRTYHHMKFVVNRKLPSRTTSITDTQAKFSPKQFPSGQFLSKSCLSASELLENQHLSP